MNTDIEHLIRAIDIAIKYSDDPSTQTSALIITEDKREIFSTNKLLIGLKDFSYWHKNTKSIYAEHAERAVIYKAAKFGVWLQNSTMYSPWVACIDCAKAIIEAGISNVVSWQTNLYDSSETWADSVNKGKELLRICGVKCIWLELPKLNRKIRIQNKQIEI